MASDWKHKKTGKHCEVKLQVRLEGGASGVVFLMESEKEHFCMSREDFDKNFEQLEVESEEALYSRRVIFLDLSKSKPFNFEGFKLRID